MSASLQAAWESALYDGDTNALVRLALDKTFVETVGSNESAYRLLRKSCNVDVVRWLADAVPGVLREPSCNGWNIFHELNMMGSDSFVVAVAMIQRVPASALSAICADGSYNYTAAETNLRDGHLKTANALLARDALVRWHLWNGHSIHSRGRRIVDAHNRARLAARVLYGILRRRPLRVPKDMAESCARAVYDTRCFAEW